MSKVGETLTKEQSKAGWKRLTAKQQKFLDNFMYRDMTQTASAREAGYSNPTVDAVRLLRNHEDMNGLNREQIIEKLEEFQKLAQGRMRNVTPAEDVRVEIVDSSEKLVDSGK
jgi:phage terminase small subunit